MKFEISIKGVDLPSSLSAGLKIPEFRVGSGGTDFVNILNNGNRGEFKGYLLGDRKPGSGDIWSSPDRNTVKTSLIGPERGYLPHQTVKGYLDHIIEISGIDPSVARRRDILDELELGAIMDCEVSGLGSGQRILVDLARGAVLDPDLFIIDLMEMEEAAGNQEKVVSFIRWFLKGSEKGAVIFVKEPPEEVHEGERFYSVMDNTLSERDLTQMPVGNLYPFRVRFVLDDMVQAAQIIRGFPHVRVEPSFRPIMAKEEGTDDTGLSEEPFSIHYGREMFFGLKRYDILPQINKELISAGIKVYEVSLMKKGGERQ
ncbi:MAG: hypothetical protein QCI82_01540 [Candidatus Thermoplasmatota archaeon]|nr:hypothetical protein [Candidatus Thermoplasmatota archaeon]